MKVCAAVVAAVAFIIYLNCYQGQFVFDDRGPSIVENPTIRNLNNIRAVLRPPSNATVTSRPVLNLTLAVNYAIEGLESTVSYHLFNVVIHILNGLLFFGLVRRTLTGPRLSQRHAPYATNLAFVCALVWVAHPLCASCVTYIIQRAESLFTLFLLLTLYCAMRSGQDSSEQDRWTIGAMVACAFGMASKEVMFIAPILVVCYDWVFRQQSLGEMLRERGRLYSGLALTWLVLVWAMRTGTRGAIAFGVDEVTPFDYAKTQPQIVLHYLRLVCWPHPLVFDYDWPIARTSADWLPYLPFIVLLGLGSVVAFVCRLPIGFLGVLFFFVLGPSSSFLVIYKEVAAEHRMYLPSAAVIVALVIGVWNAGQFITSKLNIPTRTMSVAVWVLVVCIVAVLAVMTYLRNPIFHSRIRLWEETAARAPHGARPQYNLGLQYRIAAEELREAAENLAAKDDNDEANARLAEAEQYAQKRNKQYEKAIALKPNYPNVYYSMGLEFQRQGKLEEAMEAYRNAIKHYHDRNDSPYNNLGLLVAQTGDYQEAIKLYRNALEINPGNVRARFNCANALIALERYVSARSQLEQAVQIQQSYRKAWQRLSELLSMAPQKAARDGDTALQIANGLVKESQGKDWYDLELLAAARAEVGSFEDATKIAARLSELYRDHLPDRLPVIEKRLRAYRRGQPAYMERSE